MKTLFAALFSAIACLALPTTRAAAQVEMITDTRELQPASTLEFRFAAPMIASDDVGIAVAMEAAPVVITPAVSGNFTWLSRSSGVFAPEQAWPLGESFTFTLRAGLVDAAGRKLPGNFKQILRTPEFGRTVFRGGGGETCDPVPRIIIACNLAIDLPSAQGLFRFVKETGAEWTARVSHATLDHYIHVPIEHDDWEKRWSSARGLADEPVGDRDAPIANRLVIEPATPLTPGSWRLEMKPGLASQDGKNRIRAPWSLPLGKVPPFDITELRADNYINSGRLLTIGFSHRLAPDIMPAAAGKFLRFDPPVAKLSFEGWSDTLIASGDFETNRDYRLIVGEDLISGDALPFAGERSRTFRFNPVKPRLYLPEITASQIQGGNRRFEVLSANLTEIRVVARLVDPDDAAAAIEAFGKYERENADYENREFYQPLPVYSFRSERIAERRIPTTGGPLDARQVTAVDWNDVLGARKTGVIFLTVEGSPREDVGGKRPGAQALIQLTDLGVMWKKISTGLQVTVFSLENGKPLENATVTLLDKEFKTTRQAVTNAGGIATPAWAEESEWMIVRKDADAHALRIGMAADELPMHAFNLPISYANWISFGEKRRPMRAQIFTDRPLYRPGETVRVKGILRDLTESSLALAAACEGRLTLRDARGREVFTKDVKTDVRGAFDTEITLGSTAGAHRIMLEIPDVAGGAWNTGFNCGFMVADFQPDAFELKVITPERLAPGTKARAQVTARYLFGSPLDRADLRWTLIERKEYFRPQGYDRWKFGNNDDSEQALTLRGESVWDGRKPFVIEPQLPAASSPRRAHLTVEVTDINQQTVSTSVSFTRDAADFQLGAALPQGRVARVGEEMPLQVIAVRPDGKPLDKSIEVNAELIHRRFETVRVRGAGNAISFRTETIEEPVAKTTGLTLKPARDNGSWKVEDGTSLSFRIDRTGGYHVRLTARDSKGREVVNVMPVYISGRDEVSWDYRNPAHVDLVADKEEYRPGDTARLLVKAPITGEALVTIERGERILRRMRVTLEGNAPEIVIPLEEADSPNVFVSLMLIRGREHSTLKHKMPGARYGVAMLRVRQPDERLNVEVKPTMPEVLPGEEVEVEVRVHNEVGKAVADAEVVLFAPDDGILAITGYDRPQPGNIFHAPFPLAIRTGLTLFGLLPEDPEALEFSNKGYLIGGGGDGMGGPGVKVRNDFPGTAAWFPKLRTDSAGIARAKFNAPDALTRYRLVAVVHAGAKGFGSAESSFAIRQPLMILPGIGQSANIGDEIAARAVIRNESGSDGTVEVSLTLDATAEALTPGSLQQRIPVKNGTSAAVDFPVRLIAMGDAQWSWSARSGSLTDETVSHLKVGSAAPLLRETYLTELAAGKRSDLLASVNPQLLEGAGEVTVTLSNTRLASLRESATQLMEYPYGCAEQIVSGLIPWILLEDLKPVMPQLADHAGDARVAVQNGLDRLFSMQTSDGGIAYWPGGGQSSLFASAYAAVACSWAGDDFQLPAGHDALLDFLSQQLRGGLRITQEDRALALFALAVSGRAEPAYHEGLYHLRKELTGEARGWLAMAVLAANGPEKMIETLLDPKVTSPDAVSWFGGPARERAVQLHAWTLHKPKAPEVAKLVKELLEFRQNGHWGTTQNNAWTLMALARYYAAAEQGSTDVNATLVAAGREFPFQLNAQTISASHAFGYAPDRPLGPLAAVYPPGGKLFGETLFVVRPLVAKQPAQNRGYAVSRTYQKLGDDGNLLEATNLKVGDRLVVTLRIETARPGHFVAIDDPLPAILEAVNPAFKSRAVGDGPQERDWVSDHRETRADRVLYFCDHLAPGSYTFRYLARVRMAGTVHAGPTKVEEMYRPERFGLGEAVVLTSQSAID
jgi:alpha-2-macroglobulin